LYPQLLLEGGCSTQGIRANILALRFGDKSVELEQGLLNGICLCLEAAVNERVGINPDGGIDAVVAPLDLFEQSHCLLVVLDVLLLHLIIILNYKNYMRVYLEI
jgi:hypothetical protein